MVFGFNMNPLAQLERLVSEVRHRGALMDDVAEEAAAILTAVPGYPGLFGVLVKRHAFVAFDVGGIRVYGNIQGEEDSLEDLLADKILTGDLVEAGFLPFGRPTTGSYDRICFDVRERQPSEEAPVVLMDHESILTYNRIPDPKRLAHTLMDLFETDGEVSKS